MARILSANVDITKIGLDNGEVIEITTNSLDFIPQEGQIVEVYVNGEEYIVKQAINQNNTVNVNVGGFIGRPVNKLAYALLAIFVGGIGIHKFYAGRTGSGILYLLLCWTFIPGLVAFIEGIVALTKTADDNGNIYI